MLNSLLRYEFRKRIFQDADVSSIVIYATRPVGQFVGEFTIADVIRDTPKALWSQTSEAAGVDHAFFESYFRDYATGIAIKVGDVQPYSPPIEPTSVIDDFHPPQSFRYWNPDCS